jgi:hydroxymethylglutaryl-CoA lyase
MFSSGTSYVLLYLHINTLATLKLGVTNPFDCTMSANSCPQVIVREVGLRDGLQSIKTILPTAQKLEWMRAAHAAGQREIEVGSFVPARLLPQLADTVELVAHAKTLPGLIASVLVPNFKGAERAIEVDADAMLIPVSASAAHSAANVRKTPDEMIDLIAQTRAARDAAGSRTLIEVGMSTAFGCTIQGHVSEDEVIRLLRAALDAGADRVGLADTVGYADPAQVRRLFEKAFRALGSQSGRLACGHFHDTRGLALANTLAALDVGVRRFDTSLAGIGGCPHAPGASGNAATEDTVFMLKRMGYDTGIDLTALLELRKRVAQWLHGEQLGGAVWRAGIPKHTVGGTRGSTVQATV